MENTFEAELERSLPSLSEKVHQSTNHGGGRGGETKIAMGRRRPRRKLRPLVISMGGERQKHIEDMFSHPSLSEYFEKPVFTPGVSSRTLRNRFEFLKTAHEAKLIPQREWEALKAAKENPKYALNSEHFFNCLKDNGIPIATTSEDGGRRIGNQYDLQMHYSVELWHKGKSLNRGRSVFACLLAHLIAIPKFIEGNYDFILEDNVRVPLQHQQQGSAAAAAAQRIWDGIDLSEEWNTNNDNSNTKTTDTTEKTRRCHYRYVGWLGSISNLQWIYESHKPLACRSKGGDDSSSGGDDFSIYPFPTAHDIEMDLAEKKKKKKKNMLRDDEIGATITTTTTTTITTCQANNKPDEVNENNNNTDKEDADAETGESSKSAELREPGGNAVWGCYAYWISKEAYEKVLKVLQNDVGAMLWKNKRARYYKVKPIDKILPRQIMRNFGKHSVHIPSRPSFFRAPMLTSKIHTQWDPEFCKSTEYQLRQCGYEWDDLWLTSQERAVVTHYTKTGKWVTSQELEQQEQQQDESNC